MFTYQVIKIFAFPLIGLDYLGAHLVKCLCFIHNKVDFHRIPQQGGLHTQGAVKMAKCKELATKRETGVQSQDPRGRGGESVPKSCSLIFARPGTHSTLQAHVQAHQHIHAK